MMDKVQEACNLKHFRSHKFADFRLSLLCKHVRSVPFSLLFLALYCHEQNVQMYNQYWKRLITYSLYISSSTTEILQKDSLFNTFKTNFVMQLTSLKQNNEKSSNSPHTSVHHQMTLHVPAVEKRCNRAPCRLFTSLNYKKNLIFNANILRPSSFTKYARRAYRCTHK